MLQGRHIFANTLCHLYNTQTVQRLSFLEGHHLPVGEDHEDRVKKLSCPSVQWTSTPDCFVIKSYLSDRCLEMRSIASGQVHQTVL